MFTNIIYYLVFINIFIYYLILNNYYILITSIKLQLKVKYKIFNLFTVAVCLSIQYFHSYLGTGVSY